jgi:WD40 repeat protein
MQANRIRYLVLILSGLILTAAFLLVSTGESVSQEGSKVALITATPLPPVNPTPFGGPITVGAPLPTPELARLAIKPSNVDRLTETMQLGEPTTVGVSDALFTRNGQRLGVFWYDLIIWQMPEGKEMLSLPLSSTRWTPLALSPDGQFAAVGNYENLGWVELWNITTQQRARQHQGGQQVRALDFNASGTLLAAGRSDGSVTVWEVETGHLLHELQSGSWTGCMGMAFHPEHDEIAASSANNTIRIWDAWSGQVKSELSLPNPPGICRLSDLAYRPDGQMLAAAMFWERSIALWEGDTFIGNLTHSAGGRVWQIAWSPDGKLLVAAEVGEGRQIVLWDVQRASVAAILEERGSIATFSPDGAMLVTSGRDDLEGITLRVLTIPKPIVKKLVTPQGQVNYGDELTYTLRLVFPEDRNLVPYDRIPTYTTYISGSLDAPAGVAYDPVTNAINGTLNMTAAKPLTISFAVRVKVTGTLGFAPSIVNQACFYPFGGTLEGCIWSNEVHSFTYAWSVYLPLVVK